LIVVRNVVEFALIVENYIKLLKNQEVNNNQLVSLTHNRMEVNPNKSAKRGKSKNIG
jgi:hypothetical protein